MERRKIRYKRFFGFIRIDIGEKMSTGAFDDEVEQTVSIQEYLKDVEEQELVGILFLFNIYIYIFTYVCMYVCMYVYCYITAL